MRNLIKLFALAIIASAGLTTTMAQENAPMAEVLASSSGIEFIPQREFGSATLRVRMPNGDIVNEFFGGEDRGIFFSAYSRAGEFLQEGTYHYELWFTPKLSRNALQLLAEARNANDMTLIRNVMAELGLEHFEGLQYGTFGVVEGEILMVTGDVGSNDQDVFTRDNVIADDLIVQFSACIGNDCVNGESFGFDTLRLKENNLRIHFNDTSNSASFPTNDWRIVINDSSNGGGNYFAVEDSTAGRIPFRVEAGAPVNSLYVEADGDVGVKTANPVVDLHVVEGNTPTLRLEQDGSDGFTAQTWDVAGNEANFFIRDVTNGSRLSFRIEPGAPESSIHIDNNGVVGIGTSNPDFGVKMHIYEAGSNASLRIERSGGANFELSAGSSVFSIIDANNGTVPLKIQPSAPSNSLYMTSTGDIAMGASSASASLHISESDSGQTTLLQVEDTSGSTAVREVLKLKAASHVGFNIENTASSGSPWRVLAPNNGTFLIDETADGAQEFFLDATGNLTISGMLDQGSDRNSKENFKKVEALDVLDRVLNLEITEWNYIGDNDDVRHLGPMAQDFHSLFGLGKDDRHIATLDTSGVALASIQGLSKIIDSKDAKINELNNKLEEQEARLKRLEALIQKQLTDSE